MSLDGNSDAARVPTLVVAWSAGSPARLRAGATGWSMVAVEEEDDGVSGETEPWARHGVARALDLLRKRAVSAR
jgi:hypothetical protein